MLLGSNSEDGQRKVFPPIANIRRSELELVSAVWQDCDSDCRDTHAIVFQSISHRGAKAEKVLVQSVPKAFSNL